MARLKRTASGALLETVPSKRCRKPTLKASRHDVEVEKAFLKFPQHTPLLRRLYGYLYFQVWKPIAQSGVEDLGLNWPVLIPHKRCWKDGFSPSAQQMLEFCAGLANSKKIKIESGGHLARSKTLGDVLDQLHAPVAEPLAAHNIPVDGYGELDVKAIPHQHAKLQPGPDDEVHYSMNVTPANKIVDIHIDQGTCGLSIGVAQPSDDPKLKVEKIWFFWPPTPQNLDIYVKLHRSVESDGPCLLRSKDLGHGIIGVAGHEQGVLIPPGWLHATITVHSGFLCGITFAAPAMVGMVATIFARDLDIRPTLNTLLDRLPLYYAALRGAHTSHLNAADQIRAVVIGWLVIESSITSNGLKIDSSKRCVRECKELLTAMRLCFSDHIVEPGKILDISAACCARHGQVSCDSLKKHFWEIHLKNIIPHRYKSRH